MIKSKNTYRVLIISLLVISLFAQFEFLGVRSRARADGGVGVMSDGSSVFLNPAMTGFLSGKSFTAGYNYHLVGMDDGRLRRGYLAYNHRIKFPPSNVGIFGGTFSDGVRTEAILGLNLAYLNRNNDDFNWGIGLNPKLLHISYSPRDGDYDPDRDGPPWEDPLFIEFGETKNSFSLDAGFYGRYGRNLSFGVTARDILKPDMGLEQPSFVQPEFNLGLHYLVHKYFNPFCDISFRPETDNSDMQIEPRGGFTSRLSSTFTTTLAANPRLATAGLTMSVPSLFRGLEFDYAFAYPLGELSDVFLTTHYMSLTVYLDRIIYHDIDLLPIDIRPLEDYQVGERTPIQVVVKNQGRKDSPGFSSSMFSLDEDGEYKTLFPSKFTSGLCAGCVDTLIFHFRPQELGKYYLVASIDDNGLNPREPTGTINEDNEDNNRDSILVDLTESPPFANIKPMYVNATAEKLSLLEEEYPVIPLVFFDADDISVEGHGNPEIIEIIASRMVDNPDVELEIRGFVDRSDTRAETEGDRLAQLRTQAIYDRLLTYQPDIAQRIKRIPPTDYNYRAPRIITDHDYRSRERDMISAENRRGEFAVRLKTAVRLPSTVTLAKGDDGKMSRVSLDDDLKQALKRNPDAFLMVRGVRLASEDEDMGILRANNLLKNIIEANPDLHDRAIAISGSGDSPSIEVALSLDGLLYRPELGPPFVTEFSGLDQDTNRIDFDITNEQSVSSWSSFVMMDGEKYDLTSGTGVPEYFDWDWKLSGHLIPPEQEVSFGLELETHSRMNYRYLSEPVSLRVENLEKVVRRLILVEYVFDAAVPSSTFLEGRIYMLAEMVIEKAKEGAFTLEIGGHTDIIGSKRRNIELSNQRARREIDRLYTALTVILETDRNGVNSWLADNNVEIVQKGYGPDVPFFINTFADEHPILIGNNDTPRGRTSNRRVVATFILE